MKQYAIDEGIPSGDIFMDHAGFSTYESMYRARDIFQVNKIIIVTQRYHMYRALYVAQAMGMEAYGVESDPRPVSYTHLDVYKRQGIDSFAHCRNFIAAYGDVHNKRAKTDDIL